MISLLEMGHGWAVVVWTESVLVKVLNMGTPSEDMTHTTGNFGGKAAEKVLRG